MNPYFLQRRTIRNYTSEPIAVEKIISMLDAASHAPTTGNMQLYSVVISVEPGDKKALSPLHFGQPMVESCAAVLTFCVDLYRFEKWCEESGTKAGFDNLQMFLCGVMDTMAVAQQFVTIAETEGYGSCYLGTTLYNCKEICRTLSLPDHVIPLITVTLGIPADKGVDVGRLPVKAFAHIGSYPKYAPGEVKSLFAEKEGREDSAGFIAENSKSSLAEVFTEVRYPKSVNEEFSAKLREYLLSQGLDI